MRARSSADMMTLRCINLNILQDNIYSFILFIIYLYDKSKYNKILVTINFLQKLIHSISIMSEFNYHTFPYIFKKITEISTFYIRQVWLHLKFRVEKSRSDGQ